MSVFAFGGEMGFFLPSDSTAVEGTSALGGSGASYNTAFARCYTGVAAGVSYIETPTIAAQADYWHHFDVDQRTAVASSTLRTVCELYDSGGTARIRLQCAPSSDTWEIQYWNGSAWVSAGSFSADGESLQIVTIRTVSNTASGSVSVWLSGTPRAVSGVIDLSAFAGIVKARHYGKTASINATQAFSQCVMANESTIGMRVGTLVATGQGTTHTFTTGGFANIDEVVYSDADLINSGTADQVELFTITPVPSFTGYVIRAIAVTARAKKSGSGPEQFQLALRHGGTTYFSSTIALDFGYGAFCNVWETDPGDAGTWLSGDIAALEIGVKSIA